ncbi:MAG: hypothetical protein H0X63_07315 [Flavobacteriales bacterium]|nr:hypothetical protein [Flavobacteriales bacterium]
MKSAQIEIQENKVIISNHNRPIFILLTFVVLTILAVVIPIIATIIVLKEDGELKFGLLISYLLCWGIAVYFIRLILWNLYGQEVISINDKKMEYHCSYKFFVDNKVTLDLANIEIYPTNNNETLESSMTLTSGDKVLESNFLLNKEAIGRIEMKIKNAL